MRIQQVAQRSGLTIDTIRFYEKRGLLDHTHFQRRENGYRVYSEAAVERLGMIKHAQAAGFTLAETRTLFGLWEQNQLDEVRIVAYLREKQSWVAGKITELEQIQSYIADKLQRYEQATGDMPCTGREA